MCRLRITPPAAVGVGHLRLGSLPSWDVRRFADALDTFKCDEFASFHFSVIPVVDGTQQNAKMAFLMSF